MSCECYYATGKLNFAPEIYSDAKLMKVIWEKFRNGNYLNHDLFDVMSETEDDDTALPDLTKVTTESLQEFLMFYLNETLELARINGITAMNDVASFDVSDSSGYEEDNLKECLQLLLPYTQDGSYLSIHDVTDDITTELSFEKDFYGVAHWKMTRTGVDFVDNDPEAFVAELDPTGSPKTVDFEVNQKDAIYTHNLATDIVDLFEDILGNYSINEIKAVKEMYNSNKSYMSDPGILIPDDDREGDEGEACLYGTTYSNLLDEVESILVESIKRGQSGERIIEGIYR